MFVADENFIDAARRSCDLTIALDAHQHAVPACSSRSPPRCMGMLNALRKFFIPAASPAMFNVVFIVCDGRRCVPLFTAIGIEPVMALSVGMLGGGLAQIVAQWPALRREGYRHQWILNSAGSRAARSAGPDGTRHARRGGRADQPAREHLARHVRRRRAPRRCGSRFS